jgi:hypothetical protein
MTQAQVIALNPTAFKETLERRVAELSDLIARPGPLPRPFDTLATERAILEEELRLLRAGQKSALEVKVALVTREISI